MVVRPLAASTEVYFYWQLHWLLTLKSLAASTEVYFYWQLQLAASCRGDRLSVLYLASRRDLSGSLKQGMHRSACLLASFRPAIPEERDSRDSRDGRWTTQAAFSLSPLEGRGCRCQFDFPTEIYLTLSCP